MRDFIYSRGMKVGGGGGSLAVIAADRFSGPLPPEGLIKDISQDKMASAPDVSLM